MYKFAYFDDQVKSIFSDRNAFWDTDLEQELSLVLETLKQCGEVEGASCGIKPGITALVYELTGRTFQIDYTVDVARKEIRFYEFKQMSHSIDWRTALKQDLCNGEDQPVYIPQISCVEASQC